MFVYFLAAVVCGMLIAVGLFALMAVWGNTHLKRLEKMSKGQLEKELPGLISVNTEKGKEGAGNRTFTCPEIGLAINDPICERTRQAAPALCINCLIPAGARQ